jgi:hypothetical protein
LFRRLIDVNRDYKLIKQVGEEAHWNEKQNDCHEPLEITEGVIVAIADLDQRGHTEVQKQSELFVVVVGVWVIWRKSMQASVVVTFVNVAEVLEQKAWEVDSCQSHHDEPENVVDFADVDLVWDSAFARGSWDEHCQHVTIEAGHAEDTMDSHYAHECDPSPETGGFVAIEEVVPVCDRYQVNEKLAWPKVSGDDLAMARDVDPVQILELATALCQQLSYETQSDNALSQCVPRTVRAPKHVKVDHWYAGQQVDVGQVKVEKGQKLIVLRVYEKVIRQLLLPLTAATKSSPEFWCKFAFVAVTQTFNHVLKLKLPQPCLQVLAPIHKSQSSFPLLVVSLLQFFADSGLKETVVVFGLAKFGLE